MTIGTIPMGYNEGIDRRLSGKGGVTIKEKRVQNYRKSEYEY